MRSGVIPSPRPPCPGVCLHPKMKTAAAYFIYYAWADSLENLALTLLVARVFTDHEYVALAANHLALVADPLHARLDLHGFPLR